MTGFRVLGVAQGSGLGLTVFRKDGRGPRKPGRDPVGLGGVPAVPSR